MTDAQADSLETLADVMALTPTTGSGELAVKQAKVQFSSAHGYPTGAILYLSQDSPGTFTTVKPINGNVQRLGLVQDSKTIIIDVQEKSDIWPREYYAFALNSNDPLYVGTFI